MTGPAPFRAAQKQKHREPTERDLMTPEHIVQIVKSKGTFEVSWRYRDEWLVRRCNRLVRDGTLRRVRGEPGRYYYQLRT